MNSSPDTGGEFVPLAWLQAVLCRAHDVLMDFEVWSSWCLCSAIFGVAGPSSEGPPGSHRMAAAAPDITGGAAASRAALP